MKQIKVLRLYTGDDIICHVEETRQGFMVYEPMHFALKSSRKGIENVLLDYWLPISVIEDNRILLQEKDIVGTIQPSEVFAEFYSNTIETLKNIKEKSVNASDDASSNDENLSSDQMDYILDNMESILGPNSKRYLN